MSAPAPRSIADLDVPEQVLLERLRAGRLSEYAHLLHDADPDSTVPTFPDLAKGVRFPEYPSTCNPVDYAASLDKGFVTPAYPVDSNAGGAS